jgi:hypothetical protein
MFKNGGYQPEGPSINTNNPPTGGSGVFRVEPKMSNDPISCHKCGYDMSLVLSPCWSGLVCRNASCDDFDRRFLEDNIQSEYSSTSVCLVCGHSGCQGANGLPCPWVFPSADGAVIKNHDLSDNVNHPTHYKADARCSNCNHEIECIDVVRGMSFNLGNAMKYIWRCEKKGNKIEDLRKALWYIEDEIKNNEKNNNI